MLPCRWFEPTQNRLRTRAGAATSVRRWLLLAPCAWAFARSAGAQPQTRLRRIAVLGNVRPAASAVTPLQLLLDAFHDLGWSEGKTVSFEYHWAEQRYERFPELARELVALEPDLILVTGGVTAALAVKEATTTIPVLAILVADPVKFGLVASLAHPGANVTALAQPLPDWGKFLELAREAVAGATRIAVIGNPTNVVYADYAADNAAAARRLGMTLQMIPVSHPDQFAAAFDAMKAAHAEVLVFGPDGVFVNSIGEILERARAIKLPVIGPMRGAAEQGAVVAYSADIRPAIRKAAVYADRLLRGAKAADLPVEQATHFELTINVKAARALGLTIPQSLLLRADAVIE